MLKDPLGAHRVERRIVERQRIRRREEELDVRRAAATARFVYHRGTRIDADATPRGTHDLGDGACVVAGSAPHVQHAHARGDPERCVAGAFAFRSDAGGFVEIADQIARTVHVRVAERMPYIFLRGLITSSSMSGLPGMRWRCGYRGPPPYAIEIVR